MWNKLDTTHRKWLRISGVGLIVLLVYAVLVRVYFAYESFSTGAANTAGQGPPGLGDALWYVVMNPTNLGAVGQIMLYPSTTVGRLIGVIFALTSLGLFGLFIGKIAEVFQDYREYRRLGRHGTNFQNHIVIIGWSRFSDRVAQQLFSAGYEVVVVTNEKGKIDAIQERLNVRRNDSAFVLYAAYENYDILGKANITDSYRVFLNCESDTETLITLLNFHNRFSPNFESESTNKLDSLKYVVHVKNSDLLPSFTFEDKNVNVDPVPAFQVAAGLVSSFIYEPAVAEFGEDLIAAARHDEDYDIQEYLIRSGSDTVGKTYEALFWELFDEDHVLPIGLSRKVEGKREVNLLPAHNRDLSIQAGDYVLVIVNGETEEHVKHRFGVEQGMNPEYDPELLPITKHIEERSAPAPSAKEATQDASGYAVIIGWDEFADGLTQELYNAGKQVGVITNSEDIRNRISTKKDGLDNPGRIKVLRTSFSDIQSFREIDIENADKAFVNLPNDEDKLLMVLDLKKEFR